MSQIPHLLLCVAAISLFGINPALMSQSAHRKPDSVPALTSVQSPPSDEETVRKLTEQYGSAITEGELEKIRQFWNPQSRNLASRVRFYRELFSETRISFINAKVTRLEVSGERAVSHLTSDERQLDKKTGAVTLTYDPFHGACRSFEWIKTGTGWKIEREILVQDDLAAKLDAASSEQKRNELLETEKIYVTDVLVRALVTRGLRYQERGDYDAAIRCFQLQQTVSEKIGDRVGVAGAWLNFGIIKNAQQDFENALPVLRKALALYEEIGSKPGVARALQKLSRLYLGLGDHRQAFDCAQKSLKLSEESKHRRGIALALTELSIIYGRQNNPEQSLSYLEEALAIAQELSDTILTATLRHDIAIEHIRLRDYARAFEIYQGLLKQTESFGDVGGGAMIRDQIGSILAAQGKYEEALHYYQQALAAFEATNQSGGITLNNMSMVYLAEGKYVDALPLAEKGVSQSREHGTQREVWSALTSLGYCHLGLNHFSEAKQAFAEAISIIEKMRTQTAGGEDERQRYFESGLRAHYGMLSLLVKQQQSREALSFAERAKARALLDVLQLGRTSVHKAMTPEEEEQEGRLKLELVQLNKQLGRVKQSDKPDAKRIADVEARLEKTRLNYQAFQNSLYSAHPELKVQRGEAPIIDPSELAALLPGSTSAILEYVVSEDQVYIFAVTKPVAKADADVHLYTVALKRDELSKQIESFRRQLAERNLGFRDLAHKLYNLLIKPAEAQLRGKTNIVIAADDKLWDLPFQALLTGANRFLIEDAAIAYTPSLTVLREMTKRRKEHEGAGTTLLALGNPQLGKSTVTSEPLPLRHAGLTSLPEAEQEVIALRRLYGTRSKVYVRAGAREDLVKREAGKAKILHFATHGMLDNGSPMYSHLVLAPGSTNEDGLLEAWELMQLDLKAELAVLSACETARGRIGAGEGMIGLSWAMFIAGVPSIVVSQWKVEAASTRDLMVNFHRSLISAVGADKATPTKTEALRQAALRVMKNPETRHPFYWAGFVLVGDGR